MSTRAKAGTFRLNPKYDLNLSSTTPISPLPTSVRSAMRDPCWLTAMQEEYRALMANRTWTLVPRPAGANLVSGKWIFRHKLRSNGSLERYKARWVLRGFSQRPDVDFDETFSPVVKSATIRTVLAVAAARYWPVHQMDVNNAFLHGFLQERVYCQQPAGFVDDQCPDHVCLLNRSLYGLKQAPRAWYDRFMAFLCSIGFVVTKSDHSLYVLRRGQDTAFLLLYVDDIVLMASTDSLLCAITRQLQAEFSMKDLGPLRFFLGIRVTRSATGFFLDQEQYVDDLLERVQDCKPISTPVDTHTKLDADTGSPVRDASEYRSLVGAL